MATASVHANAELTAMLRAHLSHSAPHPAMVHPVQACTRFAWTAGGGPLGTVGTQANLLAPAPQAAPIQAQTRAPGLKVVFQWSVASVAAEWKRWEQLMAGGGVELPMSAEATPPGSSSPAMRGHAGPVTGSTAASASAAASGYSGAAHAQPVLPSPALRTGARWSVLVENCFFQARGAAAAAAGLSTGASTKLYRVRTSHGSGAVSGAWMLTPSLVLEGGAAMDRFIDSAGGASSGGGGGSSHSSDSSSPVHLRSVVAMAGEEWVMGDVVVRLATCKVREKLQSVMVMELEHTACSAPSPEACRPLYELAAALGVPLTLEAMAATQFQSGAARIAANLGLAHATTFTPAHAALQYVVLSTQLTNASISNIAAQAQGAGQA